VFLLQFINIMSKFVRTTITNPDGSISPARINTETGEIKPYKHWKQKENEEFRKQLKLKRKDGINDATKPLFWEIIPPPAIAGGNEKKENKAIRKSKENVNNIYLQEFLTLSEAIEDVPILDNLITGVSKLDSGNKNPINKGLLFSMLRDLDVINVTTVQQYTGYSERYCRKLVQYLFVLSTAFDNEIEKN